MKTFLRDILCGILLASLASCSSPMRKDQIINQAGYIPPPVRTDSRMRQLASEFGAMLRAYHPFDKQTLVYLDVMANNAAAKDVPQDLSPFVEANIQRMGGMFLTRNIYNSAIVMQSTAASPTPLSAFPWSGPSFMVKGQLLCNEDTADLQREKRIGIMRQFKAGDVEIDGDRLQKAVVKTLRVNLSLANAAGVSFPGVPSVTYQVRYSSDTNTSSLSLFFDGTGGGVSKQYQVNQSLNDAVADATTACVIQLFGTLFKVPYYKCAPDIFSADPLPAQLMRNELSSCTRDQLLNVVHDIVAVGQTSKTPAQLDSAAVAATVRAAGYKDTCDGLSKYIMNRWQNLDYHRAAPAAEHVQFADERDRAEKAAVAVQERIEQDRRKSEPDRLAEKFGWPAGTNVLVLDLHQVADPAARQKITSTAARLAGDNGVKPPADNSGVYSMRYDQPPAVLHKALRELGLNYNFVWTSTKWHALVAVPAATAAATTPAAAQPTADAAGTRA